MNLDASDHRTRVFVQLRPKLQALGYRMLGSVSDADDIVQEAYLRWSGVDVETLDQPEAFLTQIVTRLCLDHLKSARVRRETYVGPWLPEPLVAATGWTTDSEAGIAHDVSYAFMLLLDGLSPAERAAFVLHDVFGLSFEDVAPMLGKTTANCRQLASRARAQIRDTSHASPSVPEEHPIAKVFITALQTGDLAKLHQTLTADAVLISDGGGNARAARRPIVGRERIARMLSKLSEKNYRPNVMIPTILNGQPGIVLQTQSGTAGTFALEIKEDRIHRIYIIRNPEKLRHLPMTFPKQ